MAADARAIITERNVSHASDLLRSLVPRAQVFCFYDQRQQCVWSSDGAEDFEIDKFVTELPRDLVEQIISNDECLRRTLKSGRTVLALPTLDENKLPMGLLIALFSKNDGKSSSFNPQSLKSILDPALKMIGESLRVSNKVRNLNQKMLSIEREREFIYDIDEKIHSMSGQHSSLAQLVGRSGRFLEISYSILLIPSKRIRISATHSSWKTVDRKIIDRYLLDQLLPKLDGQGKPVVFEIPTPGDEQTNGEPGCQALLCPLRDYRGNVEGVLALLGRVRNKKFSKSDRRFVSHIGRKIEYVIEQSFDATTGLMNRSGFDAQLKESYASLKSDKDAHQLLYFDLDNLQLINDTFDRKAGDEVIDRFARLLDEDLRNTAVLSRLTGDNFCMLLTHATSDAALACANELREKVSTLRYLEGDKSLQVTMSMGIAEFNRYSEGHGSALTTARMACEAAKEGGGDRIEIFDESNRSVVRRYDDMQLVTNIQHALDGENGDEFELMAQPISSLAASERSSRFEILLRMGDKDGGRIETKALFSAAERYRMMPQIDRWVVSATVTRLAKIRDVVIDKNAIFSINLSGQSIGDDDFLNFIESEIDNSGLPSALFCFEITESAAVSNLKKAQSFIDRLRDRGCSISLDDFGTGLSSFAYLKNFNVDTLKIDGSFIRDITDNRISEAMVAAITEVAKVMRLKTIAEYVETNDTWQLVSALGVDFAQGHFIGKPANLDCVLTELLDKPAA